jgi:hypothetical protein
MRKNRFLSTSPALGKKARLVAVALALALARGGVAQEEASQPPAPTQEQIQQQRVDRQERLRRHREEMLKRLEESKSKREERLKEETQDRREERAEQVRKQRELVAQRQVDEALREGKPLPDAAVTALAGKQSAQRQAAYDKIECLVYGSPLSASLAEGERVAIDYILYNKSSSALTELCLALQYQPWALRPVAIYAPGLREMFKSQPTVHLNPERGLLTIRGFSTRPAAARTGIFATVVWEGIAPMRETSMPFIFRDEMGTAARLGVEDRLGDPNVPDDGAIETSFRVEPFGGTKLDVRRAPDGGLVSGMFDAAGAGGLIGLFLVAEELVVHAEDEFSVAIWLNNPDRALFDRVDLAIRYDPETLEAVDFDQGASMRRGININDETGISRFSFDHFFANDADNQEGRISYKVASGGARNHGQGILAVARFKAKKPVPAASVWLEHPADSSDREGTRVTRLGEDILVRDPLEEIAVLRVLPPRPPTEEELAAEAEKKLAQAQAQAAASDGSATPADKEPFEKQEEEELVLSVGQLSFMGGEESKAAQAGVRKTPKR